MSSSKPTTPLSGRNKIITAVSIAAVAVASLFAVGANLGILNQADKSNVGTVAAAGDLVPAGTRVVDVYLDQQGTAPTSAAATPAGAQNFSVDTAGTVTVSATGGRAQLDLITPAAGWTGKAVQTTGADVAVSFTNGSRTLEFTATVAADGTIKGDVTESTGATAPASSTSDHESHEGNEHEGGESDD